MVQGRRRFSGGRATTSNHRWNAQLIDSRNLNLLFLNSWQRKKGGGCLSLRVTFMAVECRVPLMTKTSEGSEDLSVHMREPWGPLLCDGGRWGGYDAHCAAHEYLVANIFVAAPPPTTSIRTRNRSWDHRRSNHSDAGRSGPNERRPSTLIHREVLRSNNS